jgi:hypothetical protein
MIVYGLDAEESGFDSLKKRFISSPQRPPDQVPYSFLSNVYRGLFPLGNEAAEP